MSETRLQTVDGAEAAGMSGAERDIEEMAYLLFRAYRAQVTPTSTPPAWSELNEDTRAGWRAAAAFVIATGDRRTDHDDAP